MQQYYNSMYTEMARNGASIGPFIVVNNNPIEHVYFILFLF